MPASGFLDSTWEKIICSGPGQEQRRNGPGQEQGKINNL